MPVVAEARHNWQVHSVKQVLVVGVVVVPEVGEAMGLVGLPTLAVEAAVPKGREPYLEQAAVAL
jgi:hypothetical protein